MQSKKKEDSKDGDVIMLNFKIRNNLFLMYNLSGWARRKGTACKRWGIYGTSETISFAF